MPQTTTKIRINKLTNEQIKKAITCNRTFTKILQDNKGFLEKVILKYTKRNDQRFEELYWVAAASLHRAMTRFNSDRPDASSFATFAFKVIGNDILSILKEDEEISSKEISIEKFRYSTNDGSSDETEYREMNWNVQNSKSLEDMVVDKIAREQCLQKLSGVERQILELKAQRYTMKEIAKILNKNFHSLRSIHFEACHNPEYKQIFQELK